MKRPFFVGYETSRGFDERWVRGSRFELEGDDLNRHAFVCGATGAGKTVFAKALVEESLLSGVPVVAIDVKGDLVSMALARGLLRDQDFQTLFGEDGPAVRKNFDDGISGQRAAQVQMDSFAKNVDVRVYSPRGVYGEQLALAALPSFDGPVQDPADTPDRRTLIQSLVRGLGMRMYGERAPKSQSEELKFLETLVGWCADQGKDLSGEAGIHYIGGLVADPPFGSMGGMPMEEYLPEKRRTVLRRKLASLVTGAEQDAFGDTPLSIETLITPNATGKTPLSIIYLGHLSDFQLQAFIVAQVCSELYRWMRATGGAKGLRTLFFMDEIGGGDGRSAFFPSFPYNPPSKEPLNLLVKQGRSAGLGVLLATQNPMSVDVRALGNIGTMVAGQLTQKNDQNRVQSIFEDRGAKRFTGDLAQAPTGTFLVTGPSMPSPVWVKERWLSSIHRQLAPDQVRQLWRWLKSQPQTTQASPPPPAERSPAPPPPAERNPAERPPTHRPEPEFHDAPSNYTSETQDTGFTADGTEQTAYLDAVSWMLSVDGQEHTLSEGTELVFGRSRSCDVVVSDTFVSSKHLKLEIQDGAVIVTPLKPKNPPKVQGQRLEGPTRFELLDAPVSLLCGKTQLELRVDLLG